VRGSVRRWSLVLVLVLVLAGAIGAISVPVLATSAVAAISSPCDLALKPGSRFQGPPHQFHVDLVVVNAAPAFTAPACRVSGWPEVELIGPAYPVFGSIYELPRQSGTSTTVTLKVGQSAHAVLTWLPSQPGSGPRWTRGYIRVVVHTDRGQSLPMALPWPLGTVLRQDGSTHPGTYVGPLTRGTA
jgi:hypothetical protein